MNLESKIKLKESVEDWADFKLRDCMPTDEDFKFVIDCIGQYRVSKEEAPLYCNPRGFALCVRGSTLLKIKFLIVLKLLKMPEVTEYLEKLLPEVKKDIDKEDIKEIVEFVSKEWPKYAPYLGKYTFVENLEKEALTEASNLTNEDKMDLWHKGQRGFNYKAASDSKLEDCYNICVKKGYSTEVNTLLAEGKLRGLAWAMKSISQNTAKPTNINLINLEIGDFYKSIFVRCASCKTTPANIAEEEAKNLLDYLNKEILYDSHLTAAEKAIRMRKNDFVCLIYFICLGNKAAYEALRLGIEFNYNLSANELKEICKKALDDPEILNWITYLLSLNLQESLQEDIEKHDELNPKLWEGTELKPEVEEKVSFIVNEFIKNLQEDDINIQIDDILLVGSNCSYNYTKDSDLDIHILANSDALRDCDQNIVSKLYSAYRTIFNKKFDIDFYGIPVEIFVETDGSPRISNGVYSVMQEKWIKEPVLEDIPEFDKTAFEAAFKPWEDRYNELKEKANKALTEALKLTEDLEGAKAIIADQTRGEYEAIQNYDKAIVDLQKIGDFDDVINILSSISDEEKVHVGELQYAFETINDNINDKIDSGKKEAEEYTSDTGSAVKEALQNGDTEAAKRIQQVIDFYEDREDDYYTQGRFSDKLAELEQQLQESTETGQTYIKDEIEQLIDEVYEQRKIGLATPAGEWSIENLIFKEFRNKGYLDDLKELRNKVISKSLCLESCQKLKESSVIKQEVELSPDETLQWGWDNEGDHSIFFVKKLHIIDSTRGLAEVDFVKTYSTEATAKKAFNNYLFGLKESNSRKQIKESLEKLTQTNIILHESGLFDIYNLNESEANSTIEKIRNVQFVEWVQKSIANMDKTAPYFGNKPKVTYNICGKIK